MDDQVADLQVGKRINGLTQPPATLAAEVGAAENLIATDDGVASDGPTDAEALVDTAEADLNTRGISGAENLGDARDFTFHAGHHINVKFVTCRVTYQTIDLQFHFTNVTTELLNRLHRQRKLIVESSRRKLGSGRVGKRGQRLADLVPLKNRL